MRENTGGDDAGSQREPPATDDAASRALKQSETSSDSRRLTHWQVFLLAGPIMVSNATTPLVGYVDTAVIGRLGSETLMGAVAVSAIIFNQIYWIFGFLRMGTTGFTAQAHGADDWDEVAAFLGRAMSIAVGCGLLLVTTQAAVSALAFWLMSASDGVTSSALTYFQIRIWGAPAALINFALVGWFIGLGRAHIAFVLQLILNLTNMALAILFVLVASWGVAGVGLAILVAEITAAIIGVVLAWRTLNANGARLLLNRIADPRQLKRMFVVNGDIMIRTFCLLLAFGMFTREGAQAGDLTLAINALLFSIAMIATYLLDGFAFAAETFVGKAVGARAPDRFDEAIRMTTIWAGVVACAMAAAILFGGGWMIDLAATKPEIREGARAYLWWAALVPLVGVWCFQLDGIFIGATQSRDMRNMMLISFAVFLVAAFTLTEVFGNHGLWLALYVFFIVRAVTLYARLPALKRTVFRTQHTTAL